ncbi:hypothetical protein AAG906_015992 [Vitis piasezkii]
MTLFLSKPERCSCIDGIECVMLSELERKRCIFPMENPILTCIMSKKAQNKALRITIPEIIADAVVQIMDEHLQPIYATQTTIAVPVRILGCLHCFMPFCTHNQSLGPVCTMNGEPFPNTFLVREAANVRMDERAVSTAYLPSGICIVLNAIRCKGCDSRVGNKVIA